MPDGMNGGARRQHVPSPDEMAVAARDQILRQELHKLMESNKAGFAQLAQMGARVEIADLLNLRIHTLAEMLFGNGPQMVEFQLRFERKVGDILAEMLSEARKARLAASAKVPASEIKKMARAQGLLGPDGKPLRG